MNILVIPAELIDPVDQLSANTQRRCEAGLKAFAGQDYWLVLTGGIFLGPDRQTQPAAQIMHAWFVEKGVCPGYMLVETKSLDTYQNVAFTLNTLRELGFTDMKITVLTQYQHAIRFWLTFYLAHGVWIKVIPIRQPQMSWASWFLEWLILIPCHVLDWHGNFFLARYNRQQRRRAAGLL